MEIPTILYKNIIIFKAQLKEGYVKEDRTKYISPTFFFTHDLYQNGEKDVQHIYLSVNLEIYLCRYCQHHI